MLCHGHCVFINGTAHPVKPRTYRELRELADARTLPAGTQLSAEAVELLYQMYLDGYIDLMPTRRRK